MSEPVPMGPDGIASAADPAAWGPPDMATVLSSIAVVWDRMQLAEWRLRQIVDFCSEVTERAIWEPFDLAQEVLDLAKAT